MKYSLVCVWFFYLSVSAHIKNENNEVDTENVDSWKVFPTESPLYPQLTNYLETSKILKKYEDTYDRSKQYHNKPLREKRSIENVETTIETITNEKVEDEKVDNLEQTTISTSTPDSTPKTTVLLEIEHDKEAALIDSILTSTSSSNVNEEIVDAETTTILNLETTTIDKDSKGIIANNTLQKVEKLSDQIRAVLQNYQKSGVVTIPGKPMLPDPLPMADLKKNFGFGTVMTFTNMSAYGLNNFTIEHINTDVDKLQVYLLLHMKRVVILGNYTLKSFFRQSSGMFNVTLVDVDSEGAAELQPDEDGQLQASESQMDMFTRAMKSEFKNLKSTLLQSIIDGAGIFLFDSMKPAILEKINTVLRMDFNKKLKSVTKKFTGTVSPVDIALAEGRRYCRNKGYDPYHIQNYESDQGVFTIKIHDFKVVGLSRFYRVGNLSLSMDSGIVQISMHVATEQLNGTCEWGIVVGNYEKKSNSNFTVDYLQVRALLNQSLDLHQHPQLHDLDVGLGRINVKMGSNSPIELMVAKVINTLPKLIRHIIVDAVEQPLKGKVQEILNDINVQEIVEEQLPTLDSLGL
uniref:Lipid-binding serum glycoprotein N-terminal domain-containing protein n=1 Tax=Clastoptera arizonana TaxID=38151 RepID=A0A1B6DBL0_9HEMI